MLEATINAHEDDSWSERTMSRPLQCISKNLLWIPAFAGMGLFILASTTFATPIPEFIGGLQEKNIALCHQQVLSSCDSDKLNIDNRSCIENAMSKQDNCDQALAFLKLSDGLVDSVTHYRYVDVVYASVLGADHSDDYFMIGHAGDFVTLQGTPDLDLKKVPGYRKLAKRFPEMMLWPLVTAEFDTPKETSQKHKEKILFEQEMTNGCHACERTSVASVAYIFNDEGEFVGAKVEKLSAINIKLPSPPRGEGAAGG